MLKLYWRAAPAVLALMFTATAAAQAIRGLNFQHQDWLLVCDNTGTCRATGYTADDGHTDPASVLLTRAAGADAPVRAELTVATESETEIRQVELRINGRSHGTVMLEGNLSTAQTQALLTAIQRHSSIELLADTGKRLTISDSGAAAVLLKMDDFQRRVGTPSALVRPGNARHPVLAPQAKPRLQLAPVSTEPARDIAPNSREYRRLLALLSAFPAPSGQTGINECFRHKQEGFTIQAIDHTHALITVPCLQGAYQSSDMYFVLNRGLTRVLQRVGDLHGGLNDGYSQGQIASSFKGRGLGDCWYTSNWIWTGRRFVLAQEMHTGLCRGFPGGAWNLPQHVSDVLTAAPANRVE